MWKGIGLTLLSTWKFMFAPLAGPVARLSFWETFVYCLIGAYISAIIFYFGSTFFMNLSHKNTIRKKEKALSKGKPIRIKKNFTWSNKMIVRIKRTLGRYASCWMFPLFFSVPIGTIIVAKFYKHYRGTFLLVLFFLAVDALLITSLAYLF